MAKRFKLGRFLRQRKPVTTTYCLVWRGSSRALEEAITMVEKAAVLIIIDTSLQVYPASSLMNFADATIPVFYIDPKPAEIHNLPNNIKVIAKRVQKE